MLVVSAYFGTEAINFIFACVLRRREKRQCLRIYFATQKNSCSNLCRLTTLWRATRWVSVDRSRSSPVPLYINGVHVEQSQNFVQTCTSSFCSKTHIDQIRTACPYLFFNTGRLQRMSPGDCHNFVRSRLVFINLKSRKNQENSNSSRACELTKDLEKNRFVSVLMFFGVNSR